MGCTKYSGSQCQGIFHFNLYRCLQRWTLRFLADNRGSSTANRSKMEVFQTITLTYSLMPEGFPLKWNSKLVHVFLQDLNCGLFVDLNFTCTDIVQEANPVRTENFTTKSCSTKQVFRMWFTKLQEHSGYGLASSCQVLQRLRTH